VSRSADTLTAIRGVRVGHATDEARRTGTTVVLVDPPAVSFADHRGGWPGSFDTAASDLGKTFLERHAFLLTGGDIYGYDAAIGIRRYLLDEGLASPSGGGRMPGIMGTNIYDLDFARVDGVDFADLGHRACRAATARPVAEGNVGAGTGATVGPFLERSGLLGTKGGLGSSAARVGPWTVGAVTVANCVGNVFDPEAGRTIAGAHRRGARRFVEMDELLDAYLRGREARAGTTVAVLGTDAPVDHEQLARIVELAHDGIALAVRPAHMATDGDTILGFTTGRVRARRPDWRAVDALAHVAAREIARAIVRGVRAARSLGGIHGLAGGRRRA
jgi:L-aminopeptidase/D-esterase-like protein